MKTTIIDCDGKFGKTLYLGISFNHPDSKIRKAYDMAKSWAPKVAKSFTIIKYYCVDNHNANIEVAYYTSKTEGDFTI